MKNDVAIYRWSDSLFFPVIPRVFKGQTCQDFNLYTYIDNFQNPCYTALVQRGGKSIYYYY